MLFLKADFIKLGGIRITEGAVRYREENHGLNAYFVGGFISDFIAIIQMGQRLDHLAGVDYSIDHSDVLYAVVEYGEYDPSL